VILPRRRGASLMPTTLPACLLASCFRTKESEGTLQGVEPGQTCQTVTALVGFQGRGFVDGVQPDFCLSLLLEALIFQ